MSLEMKGPKLRRRGKAADNEETGRGTSGISSSDFWISFTSNFPFSVFIRGETLRFVEAAEAEAEADEAEAEEEVSSGRMKLHCSKSASRNGGYAPGTILVVCCKRTITSPAKENIPDRNRTTASSAFWFSSAVINIASEVHSISHPSSLTHTVEGEAVEELLEEEEDKEEELAEDVDEVVSVVAAGAVESKEAFSAETSGIFRGGVVLWRNCTIEAIPAAREKELPEGAFPVRRFAADAIESSRASASPTLLLVPDDIGFVLLDRRSVSAITAFPPDAKAESDGERWGYRSVRWIAPTSNRQAVRKYKLAGVGVFALA